MAKTEQRSTVYAGGLVRANDLLVRRNAALPETASKIFAFIILTVFPLLFDQTLYRHITKAKFNYFVLFHLAYFEALIGIFVWYDSRKAYAALRKTEKKIKISASQILCFSYMIWACFSAAVSEYGTDVLVGQARYDGLFTLLTYGAAFLFLSQWGEYSVWHVRGLYFYAVLESIFCFVQFLCDFLPEDLNFWSEGFIGTLGNVDCFSGINALVLPSIVVSFSVMEDRWKWLALPGIFGLSYVQLYAGSDSGKLGILAALAAVLPFLVEDRDRFAGALVSCGITALGAGAGLVFPFSAPGTIQVTRSKPGLLLLVFAVFMMITAWIVKKSVSQIEPDRKKRRRVTGIIVAVLLLSVLVWLFLYSGDNTLLHEVHELLHLRIDNHAGSDRGLVWKYCLQLIPKKPVFGSGPGTFLSAFKPYNDYLQSIGFIKFFDFAHNDFLQIAVCEGIPGLLLYLAFLSVLAYKAVKSASVCPLVIIYAAGLAGYLVHSFVSFSIVIVTPGFWVMAGLMDKMIKQLPEQLPEKLPEKLPDRKD